MTGQHGTDESLRVVSRLVSASFMVAHDDLEGWCATLSGIVRDAMGHPMTRVDLTVFEPVHFEHQCDWVQDDLARRCRHHEHLAGVQAIDSTHPKLAEGAQALSIDGAPHEPHPGRFLRVLAPIEEISTHRTLAMQIERVEGGAPMADWLMHAAVAATPGFATAYASAIGLVHEHRNALLSRLNIAQRLMAPLLIDGRSERVIAEQIGRSQHTVHDHVKRIYQSWGISSRLQMRDLWFSRTPAGRHEDLSGA